MKKNLYTLLGLCFLDIVSFSFILPVLPFIVKNFGYGAIEISYCVAGSAIGMFLGGLSFGHLSDRHGKKNIILISIMANIIGYLIFALSGNIYIFILSRFICGIGGGGISVVQAFIGEISKENERMKNMGLVGASIGLGFTIGPILGGITDDIGLKNMGFISAFLLVISYVISYKCLTENSEKHSEDINIKKTPKNLLIYFISFFIITASFAGIQTIFGLYLNEKLDYNSKKVAFTFGFLGIIGIIYQGLIMQKFGHLIKERSHLIIGFAVLGVSFLIFPSLKITIYIFLVLAFFSIGLSSINSSIYALIGKHSKKNEYGKNMGINTAFGSIADIIGPLMAGLSYTYDFRIPFYLFGIILLLNIISVYIFAEED